VARVWEQDVSPKRFEPQVVLHIIITQTTTAYYNFRRRGIFSVVTIIELSQAKNHAFFFHQNSVLAETYSAFFKRDLCHLIS
jgi:hypothetical protein